MRHLADGTLRRGIDERLAVADADLRHLRSCTQCRARRDHLEETADIARRALSRPSTMPDLDEAWSRFRARCDEPAKGHVLRAGRRRRRWVVMGTSFGTAVPVAAAGVVVAGVAAATTLTTVFAPTTVVPIQVKAADLRPLVNLFAVQPSELLGLSHTSGTEALPFGQITWTSTGQPRRVSSLAEARSVAGMDVSVPSTLPSGVGAPRGYDVVPRATGHVSFGSRAGDLSGSTLTIAVGPVVGVVYSGTTGVSIPTLEVLAMKQPIITSTGATTTQLENFLLSRPGLPADLVHEVRLLGNLRNVLPVPAPSGTNSTSMVVGGRQTVLLSAGEGSASAAVWIDGNGTIHVVVGLLDKQGTLDVVRQIG